MKLRLLATHLPTRIATFGYPKNGDVENLATHLPTRIATSFDSALTYSTDLATHLPTRIATDKIKLPSNFKLSGNPLAYEDCNVANEYKSFW